MFSKSRIGILLVSVLMLVGSLAVMSDTAAQDTLVPGCPVGQGYWKNTANWPATALTLGGQTYSQAELLILFNSPVSGDASVNLAHQLTTAKLNVANGSDATVISGVIAQADTLLATHNGKLPYAVDPSSSEGQTMVNLAGVLEAYNNGQLTIGCGGTATPTPTVTLTPTLDNTTTVTPMVTPVSTAIATPEATPEITLEPGNNNLTITIVIVGQVQAININIITIYNINIQLDPNDPLLQVIQIGDMVRIEGNTQTLNGTIIIIAITVVVINVDINIDTGETWHDRGDGCDNPPPPWAPAHGWHRRCDGQQGGNQGNGNGNGNGKGNKHGNEDEDDD